MILSEFPLCLVIILNFKSNLLILFTMSFIYFTSHGKVRMIMGGNRGLPVYIDAERDPIIAVKFGFTKTCVAIDVSGLQKVFFSIR